MLTWMLTLVDARSCDGLHVAPALVVNARSSSPRASARRHPPPPRLKPLPCDLAASSPDDCSEMTWTVGREAVYEVGPGSYCPPRHRRVSVLWLL